MAGEWREVTLAEVSDDITVGHVGLMADQYVTRGVPFLRSLNVEPFIVQTDSLRYITSEFHSRLKKSALKPGDVVIVRTGKPGACAVVPDWLTEANCSDLVIVRPSRQVRPSFISYVVNSVAQHHIGAHTVGAVQQHFNVGSARTLRFMIPSLVEQDRIVGLLDAVREKIELNRRMAETLEAVARALFKSWFVDFDPVHAKAEGRPTGLAASIAALFPDSLGEHSLPVGWTSQPLTVLLRNVVERVQPSSETVRKPYVPIDAIAPKSLTMIELRPGAEAQSSLVAFERDDVLFGAMRPYFHKVGLAPVAGTTRTTVFVLRPHLPEDLSFALLLASERSTIEFATNSSSGSTIPYAVWDGSLSTMEVTLPSPALRAAFHLIVLPTLRRAQSLCAQSRTLAALRDILLPKLISGELRVADAEKRIAAA